MAKSHLEPALEPVLERALKQFAQETCVPVIGASIPVGSSCYASPKQSLYRAYLKWCNSTDYFPTSLAKFSKSIVIVMNDLNWKVHIKKSYGESLIHGIKYKTGRVNHG